MRCGYDALVILFLSFTDFDIWLLFLSEVGTLNLYLLLPLVQFDARDKWDSIELSLHWLYSDSEGDLDLSSPI